MKNEMKLRIEKDCLVVLFYGDVDHETTLAYRDRLVQAIEKEKYSKVILDFENVSFIDSSGIGMVLGRYNQVRRYDGCLYLSRLPEATRRLFDLTGLFSIIEVVDQSEEVINRE